VATMGPRPARSRSQFVGGSVADEPESRAIPRNPQVQANATARSQTTWRRRIEESTILTVSAYRDDRYQTGRDCRHPTLPGVTFIDGTPGKGEVRNPPSTLAYMFPCWASASGWRLRRGSDRGPGSQWGTQSALGDN
jgi:hypothetical protein